MDVVLKIRDDEAGRKLLTRLSRIQRRLDAISSGESWIKISLLGDEVNARLLYIGSDYVSINP
jgi:hypothetical protein